MWLLQGHVQEPVTLEHVFQEPATSNPLLVQLSLKVTFQVTHPVVPFYNDSMAAVFNGDSGNLFSDKNRNLQSSKGIRFLAFYRVRQNQTKPNQNQTRFSQPLVPFSLRHRNLRWWQWLSRNPVGWVVQRKRLGSQTPLQGANPNPQSLTGTHTNAHQQIWQRPPRSPYHGLKKNPLHTNTDHLKTLLTLPSTLPIQDRLSGDKPLLQLLHILMWHNTKGSTYRRFWIKTESFHYRNN